MKDNIEALPISSLVRKADVTISVPDLTITVKLYPNMTFGCSELDNNVTLLEIHSSVFGTFSSIEKHHSFKNVAYPFVTYTAGQIGIKSSWKLNIRNKY